MNIRTCCKRAMRRFLIENTGKDKALSEIKCEKCYRMYRWLGNREGHLLWNYSDNQYELMDGGWLKEIWNIYEGVRR